MFDVRVDTRSVDRMLTNLQRKQIPFAASVALNKTAKDMQEALTAEVSVFDRPKPVTRKGVYVVRSKKTSLRAEVGLKSREQNAAPVAEFLGANIVGSTPRRQDKRSEVLLRNAGILPPGQQTRPGPGARLDSYGNMSRGQIVQIISFFRAFGSVEQSGRRPRGSATTKSAILNAPKKRKRSSAQFFVTPNGIWQRQGKKIKQVLTFINPQSYPKRFDFKGIAETAAQQRFSANYEQALRAAIATAK